LLAMNGHDYGYGKSPGQQGNPQNGWAQAQNNVPWGGPTDQGAIPQNGWTQAQRNMPMRGPTDQGALRMHVGGAAVQSNAPPNPAVDLVALKQELERFYARHNPEKLGNVPQIVSSFAQRGATTAEYEYLSADLRTRYGADLSSVRQGQQGQGNTDPINLFSTGRLRQVYGHPPGSPGQHPTIDANQISLARSLSPEPPQNHGLAFSASPIMPDFVPISRANTENPGFIGGSRRPTGGPWGNQTAASPRAVASSPPQMLPSRGGQDAPGGGAALAPGGGAGLASPPWSLGSVVSLLPLEMDDVTPPTYPSSPVPDMRPLLEVCVLAVRTRATSPIVSKTKEISLFAPTAVRVTHAGKEVQQQTPVGGGVKRWGPVASWRTEAARDGRRKDTGMLRVEVWGYKQGGGGVEMCLGYAEVDGWALALRGTRDKSRRTLVASDSIETVVATCEVTVAADHRGGAPSWPGQNGGGGAGWAVVEQERHFDSQVEKAVREQEAFEGVVEREVIEAAFAPSPSSLKSPAPVNWAGEVELRLRSVSARSVNPSEVDALLALLSDAPTAPPASRPASEGTTPRQTPRQNGDAHPQEAPASQRVPASVGEASLGGGGEGNPALLTQLLAQRKKLESNAATRLAQRSAASRAILSAQAELTRVRALVGGGGGSASPEKLLPTESAIQ